MNPNPTPKSKDWARTRPKKRGQCWIFVKEHLAVWVSEGYSEHRREQQVIDTIKLGIKNYVNLTSATKSGGFNYTAHQTDAEYNKLLGPNKQEARNYMIN